MSETAVVMFEPSLFPTYSVVTCTLGRLDTLEGMVTSLLAQDVQPLEFILVDGSRNRSVFEGIERQLAEGGRDFVYLPCRPSLVIQRNAGAAQAKGDVIFFLDDDLILKPGFSRTILQAYASDKVGRVGGVQGLIDNLTLNRPSRDVYNWFFGRTRYGKGQLQRSAWPAFLAECSTPTFVEVFSGALMTFRRAIFSEMAFDENLAELWMGDDFEFSYRVSKRYHLLQIPDANATHLGGVSTPKDPGKIRQLSRMFTINHLYLFRKHRAHFVTNWLFYFWSEIGTWASFLWAAPHDRGAAIMGVLDAYQAIVRGQVSTSQRLANSDEN